MWLKRLAFFTISLVLKMVAGDVANIRSARVFTVKLNNLTTNFYPISKSALIIDSRHRCNVYFHILNTWKERLRRIYMYILDHNFEMTYGPWLSHTDTKTLGEFSLAMQEVDHLRRGMFQPDCRSREISNCKFEQIANSWQASYLFRRPILEEQYFTLAAMAEDLFNNQLYHHSEALAYFLLFGNAIHFSHRYNLVTDDRSLISSSPLLNIEEPSSCSQLNLADEYEVSNRNSHLFLILSEAAKVKGLLEVAEILSHNLIYSMMLVSLQQEELQGSNYSLDRTRWVTYLYRLRVLLTVPHIPPSFAEAMQERESMVADLLIFAEDIRRCNITISLSSLLLEVSATPFHLSHQGLNDRDVQLALSDVFTSLCPELYFHVPHQLGDDGGPGMAPSLVRANTRAPLKIGFISSHFFEHSIGRILVGLIDRMNDARVQAEALSGETSIEVYVFSIDRTLSRETSPADIPALQAQLLARERGEGDKDQVIFILTKILSGDRFIRLPENISTVRAFLSQMRMDFLIFADIGMDLSTYVLAYSRLAPYQAAWWGHPITSGIESIDFFFSLDDELPAADSHYSEQLVRFDTINTMNLRVVEASQNESYKKELFNRAGLPENAKVFMVLGRLFKVHPEFDEMVVSILYSAFHLYELKGQQSDIYIVFIAEKVHEYNHNLLARLSAFLLERDRVLTESQQRDLLHRIKFVHVDFYYSLLPYARGVLDTYPYGGCLTTHDALSHGIPMVTLPAEFVRGRFTMSMYRQMQHGDLIAADKHMYVDLSLRLLWDEDFYQQQRRDIAGKFKRNLLQNHIVASEWLRFIQRLFVADQ